VHPGDNLVVVQLRHRGRDQLLGSQQVMKAQLAVLEHLLGLGRGVAGAQRQRLQAHALLLPEQVVPGFERGSDGRARVPSHRLHEDIFETGAAFERGNEQGVESQAARQAQVAPRAGQPHHRRLRCLLHAGRDGCAQLFGNARAVLQPQRRIETVPETARMRALRAEEGAVHVQSGVIGLENLQEQIAEARRRREPTATALCAHPRWLQTRATP
jgi:hypothetical protein